MQVVGQIVLECSTGTPKNSQITKLVSKEFSH